VEFSGNEQTLCQIKKAQQIRRQNWKFTRKEQGLPGVSLAPDFIPNKRSKPNRETVRLRRIHLNSRQSSTQLPSNLLARRRKQNETGKRNWKIDEDSAS
jgi:hypothetical protein